MTTTPVGGLVVEEHIGHAGLEALASDWSVLAKRMPRRWFHHLPEWHASYLAALAPDPQAVRFYSVRRGDVLLAILPLEVTTREVLGLNVRVLSTPKHDHVPFTDLIADPSANIQAVGRVLLAHLVRRVSSSWDLLVLPSVLDDGVAAPLVQSLARVVWRSDSACDYIPCTGASGARDIVSKNMKSNLRRTGNKLRREGDVTFEVAREGAELDEAYADLLRVEASGWKGADGTGTAIALHPGLVRFYRELLVRFGALGMVEISQLKLSGRCVAAQLALLIDGVWYQLKIGYDDSLATMAPGNLLMEQLLDRLCKDAVTEANLVSDASWHRSWNPHSYHTKTYFVGNRTVRGLGLVLLLRLRNRIRDFQERRAAARAVGSATAAGSQEEAPSPEPSLELRESVAQR